MRRRFFPTAVFSSLLGLAMVAGGPAMANPSILFDAGTGRVIESDSAFQRWYPASLTKLMTTYVAFRALAAGEVTLTSPVRISKKAAALPPSKMGYKPGSELTLDNALKIIMVKSANDVAAAIGESIGGSQAGFAAMMNAESKRLGMLDSRWVNANGLHEDDQYTTVRDLAVLSAALRKEFPQYAGYFNLEGLLASGKIIPSHNNLIARFDGADGMKTGYTCPSGFNLVGSATREGRTLMAIVMGSKSVELRDEKAAAMLARGFTVSSTEGDTLATLPQISDRQNKPVNMYEELCSKEARKAAAQAQAALAEAQKEGTAPATPPSLYLAELTRPRQLVTVGLGGATGPVPKALAAAEVFADVPIPSWRPDMPVPGAKVAEQGDAGAGAQ